jgi:hypothetical protein
MAICVQTTLASRDINQVLALCRFSAPPSKETARFGRAAAPSENDYETGRTLPGDSPVFSCERQALEARIEKKILIEY